MTATTRRSPWLPGYGRLAALACVLRGHVWVFIAAPSVAADHDQCLRCGAWRITH